MAKARLPSPQFTISVNLLHDLGLVKRCPWKRPGSTGYAPMFLVKNDNLPSDVARLHLSNFLRDVLKTDAVLFFRQVMDNLSFEVLPHVRAELPTLTCDHIDAFKTKWTPILDHPSSSTGSAGGASETCTTKDAKPTSQTGSAIVRMFAPDRVLALKSHFQWILKAANPVVHFS